MFGWVKGLIAGQSEGIPADPEAVRIILAYTQEAVGREFWSAADLNIPSMEAGQEIDTAEPDLRVRILVAAFQTLCDAEQALGKPGGNLTSWQTRKKQCRALRYLVSRLLRTRLPLQSGDLRSMLSVTPPVIDMDALPLTALVRAVEKFGESSALDELLVGELNALRRKISKVKSAEIAKIVSRIDVLLSGTGEGPAVARSPFGDKIKDWFDELDTSARGNWQALLQHAGTLANKSRPSAKWMKDATPLVAAVGNDVFAERIEDWIGGLELDPAKPDLNTDLIKALIFMAVHAEGDRLAVFLGRFCETCFRKVPGVGARSVKLGNACLHALGQMGERGVAELVRVRGRMKYAQARQQLDNSLNAAAERAGISADELEEIALPDFGLGADGVLTETFGDVMAEIRIAGSEEVALGWVGADGKPRKAVPASVKRDHAEELKALRARVKEIKGLLSGQGYRMESLYLKERSWPYPVWRDRYLEHPLMANLTRRLIWTVGGTAVVPHGDALVGADGAPVDAPDDGADVLLWHPLDADADTVLAWRRRLAALEITQPFKQAHREIYVLTDAEQETETYSNRFAAHILRQHQFSALCQARGWRYTLQGEWDSHNVPERRLEDRDLNILFVVDPLNLEDGAAVTEVGIYQFVATDRVVFRDGAGETRDLTDIPPRLFSELMRDVDLFVGVSSIGTDPEWVDRGPDSNPVLLDYWHSFNTAALTETAKTRRAVLEDLLPKLKIAEICELEERHLKVRGTRRSYKIHLGSGNIMMEPNNRYLCIVPGTGKAGGDRIALPFEGDGLLSIILSKAFMLAEDDKITDKTILSQIGRE